MFDAKGIMQSLSSVRPVFHSEADFQHAFAWQIHMQFPHYKVRLEYPSSFESESAEHLDVVILNAKQKIGVELKYKTAPFFAPVEGEIFLLKAQGAQDLGGYDFLRDVQRLEAYLLENQNANGFAIFLTNGSSYWNSPRNGPTICDSFRITEGRTITGTLSWSKGTGKGTTKGRESPIGLKGAYTCSWLHYSAMKEREYAGGRGEFRYLVLEARRQG